MKDLRSAGADARRAKITAQVDLTVRGFGIRVDIRIRHGKGDRERIVPIGERALAWIGKYMEVVRPELVVTPAEQALFLTRLGDPFVPEGLTNRVRQIVRKSGGGKAVACHVFRHAAATAMLEGGADIRFVQVFLGHAKLTTTEIYTHVATTKLKEVYAQTHPAASSPSRPAASARTALSRSMRRRYWPRSNPSRLRRWSAAAQLPPSTKSQPRGRLHGRCSSRSEPA